MGAECVRAKQSITKLHCKCLNTFPLELMLPHAGSSALILREEATLESASKASRRVTIFDFCDLGCLCVLRAFSY